MTERPVLLAEITGRIGRESLSVVAPSDFSTGPWRQRRAADRLDAFVPYCLDMLARRTVYVRAGNRAALLRAPLQYVHLRERATTIASVPWECGRVSAGSQPPGCFVFSVGRCGSTLLVDAMRRGGAVALSEPDFYTQAVAARIHAGRIFSGYARLEAVLGGLTADLLAASGARGPSPIIKLRTECCKAPGLIVGTGGIAPATLFMIRSFKPWLLSTLRVSRRPPRAIVERYIEGLKCFAWLRRNSECTLVSYEDLTADPVATLQNVASAVGARLDAAGVTAALKSDAQSGTVLARARLAEREPSADVLRRALEVWMEARPTALLAELGMAD